MPTQSEVLLQIARDRALLKHAAGTPERLLAEQRVREAEAQAERNELGAMRLRLDSADKVKRFRSQLAEYRGR